MVLDSRRLLLLDDLAELTTKCPDVALVAPVSCRDGKLGEEWENQEEQLISTTRSGRDNIIDDLVDRALDNFTIFEFKVDDPITEIRADRNVNDDALL